MARAVLPDRRPEPGETLAVAAARMTCRCSGRQGLGVALRPTPVIADLAPVAIRSGDLTALLYLQGVTKSSFVSN